MSIDPKTIRQAQLIMLEMLVEFDAICKKYDLHYWLDSGTLLGAVRHQGFIPWDDDIDLSMPVEDYIKFQEIAKEELSSDIFFQNRETDKAFLFDYIKLRSNKASIVEFHEKDKEVHYHQGVFVDIFPMHTLANTAVNKKYYSNFFMKIRETSAVSLHTPEGKNLPEARKGFVDALAELHDGWENENNKVIYGGEMPDVAAWFDMKEVFPLKHMVFEGLEFPVPNNPNHYLNAIYTFDYRQLPPEDKRTIHAHEIIIHSKG